MNRIKTITKAFSKSTKVIVEKKEVVCRMILNNEKYLNALDMDMMEIMREKIYEWKQTANFPKLLIFTANPGSKAFCAGGDIRSIFNNWENRLDPKTNEFFFKTEYELDYALSQLPNHGCETVAMWNGIVMGGGVGITINSSFRVVNESSLFAMPETGIGLFPDVGVMHHLAKLPKGVDFALGIGGMRINGPDLVYLNLASHYVNKANFEALENELYQCASQASKFDNSSIKEILNRYTNKSILDNDLKAKLKQKYDRLQILLSSDKFHECLSNLPKLETEFPELAKNLKMNSPFSMKLSFEYLKKARSLTLKETFETDMRVIRNMMRDTEFFTGVKNLLIDKSKERAKWRHAKWQDVSDSEVMKFLEAEPSDGNSVPINFNIC